MKTINLTNYYAATVFAYKKIIYGKHIPKSKKSIILKNILGI